MEAKIEQLETATESAETQMKAHKKALDDACNRAICNVSVCHAYDSSAHDTRNVLLTSHNLRIGCIVS